MSGRTQPDPPENPSELHRSLERLDPFIGTWDMTLTVPTDPPTVVRGLRSTFEWLEGNFFLIWRWGPESSDFPGGTFPAALWIIGYDTPDTYSVHYFDSRGVSRILDMALADGVWKVWREDPGFFQRFSGTFDEDGVTINVFLERSSDGSKWEHDFDITFRKRL